MITLRAVSSNNASFPGHMVQIHLYQDEPIPMVFNADDYTNIAERTSSYSKSFEVPGTQSNNIFFTYMYNVKVDGDFDPHKRTRCEVSKNTHVIFEGWLQLNGVTVKSNKQIAYEITIFSDIVNIKDTLSEAILRDLDLAELKHDYDETNIQASWTTGLTYSNAPHANGFRDGNTVKYPWVRYSPDVVFETNATTGVSYIDVPSIPTSTMTMQHQYVHRPWIQVDYLFRTIIKNAGYSIQSTFLTTDAWKKLYADFAAVNGLMGSGREQRRDPIQPNLKNHTAGTATSYEKLPAFTSTIYGSSSAFPMPTYYNATSDEIQVPVGFGATTVYVMLNLWCRGTMAVNSSDTISMTCRVMHFDNSAGTTTVAAQMQTRTINNLSNAQYNNYSQRSWSTNPFTQIIEVDEGDRLYVEYMVENLNAGTTYGVELADENASGDPHAYGFITYDMTRSQVQLTDVLSGPRGEISQWEFCKNLITMFNLVLLPDEDDPTIIQIEPYDDWVDSGAQHDWTKKVDTSEIQILPIEGLAKDITFRHSEDSDDVITRLYNKPNEWKYPYKFESGDDLYDEQEDLVETKDIASTECLYHFGTDLYAPQIMNEAGELGWSNVMRILYDNGVQTSTIGYGTSAPYAGSTHDYYYDYLLFSPANTFPAAGAGVLSVDYGVVEYYPGAGAVLLGLFNQYWSAYIDELYHKNTRLVRMNLQLSGNEIERFRFNDVVTISGVKYRVKKIEYNGINSAKVEFITIKNL